MNIIGTGFILDTKSGILNTTKCFIGEAIFSINATDTEVEFVKSEKDYQNNVVMDVGEMLEQGFVDGDTVLFGYRDNDGTGIEFVVKKSNVTNILELVEIVDTSLDTDLIENWLSDNVKDTMYVTACY